MTTPIPQPPSIPFLGNVNVIDHELPLRSFRLLAKQYGEIFQLDIFGRKVIHVTTYELANEVSDEKRFMKLVARGLKEMRYLVNDGLFTADTDMHNWGVAHRILIPAFGPANIRNMFPDMSDIASQMLLKWERMGADYVFEPTDQYTRLTLDTLALCSMSHRFNSFYAKESPPFANAMFAFLAEAQARASRPWLVQTFMRGTNAQYDENHDFMTNIARDIVQRRKGRLVVKKDLLAMMLEGRDPKTGESMTEQSIIYNLLTFLIAGHETTSGMLTFATYFLLKHPDTLRKLREEIDEVSGNKPITLEMLSRMPYLTAVMRETLRITPSASARTISANEDTLIKGGKYLIPKGVPVLVQVLGMQHDIKVWGEDAEEFRPERMLDGKFEALPPNAWQPFGFGMRGCIGRPFAWQEAQLALASIFQKFDLFMADPSYTLQIKQALAIKPKDFFIRAVPREGRTAATMLSQIPPRTPVSGNQQNQINGEVKVTAGHPMHIFHGGNTGTCENFAQRLATDAVRHGFKAELGPLDSASARLPKDGPVIIVAASFEGQPADNAAQFVNWLDNLKGDSLKGTSYVVFGCGNREWATTYQRVPILCDKLLAENGAERLIGRGEADAASATFFEAFDEFEVKLWNVLEERFQTSSSSLGTECSDFSVQIVGGGTTRASLLRQHDAGLGEVIENLALTKPGVPMKRHIEFKIPKGMSYRTGDYLAILPINPEETVRRALKRFNLSAEQEVVINSAAPTTFPVNKAMKAQELLSGYIELSQPATARDLQTLISAAEGEPTVMELKKLVDAYHTEVLAKRSSVLDLLETYKNIDLPLSNFLRLLPPMRVRQYSISSSPLINAEHATLTVSVIDAPALSGHGRNFLGVASNYLATLKPGDKVQMVVRASSAIFHPPTDPLIPVVMFSSGSGIAPFRAFIQERIAQKVSGRDVGKMLLFFGCRSPEDDYLYSESDLATGIEKGVVDVRPAFSRKSEASFGCKYVQDRIWYDHQDIKQAARAGAKFFMCGSRRAANGIKETCVNIFKANDPALSDADAAAKFRSMQKERYATDVFD